MRSNKKYFFFYNRVYNFKWILFLFISFIFYITWLAFLYTSGITFNVFKLLIETAALFLFGITAFVIRYRSFIYRITISDNMFVFNNIFTVKKIILDEISFLVFDEEALNVWIAYADKNTENNNPQFFSVKLVDFEANIEKYRDMFTLLKACTNCKTDDNYEKLICLTDEETEKLVRECRNTSVGIYGRYYWLNMRWMTFAGFLFVMVQYMSIGSALFDSRSYSIILIINLILEVLLVKMLTLKVKDKGISKEDAIFHDKRVKLYRRIFLIASVVIYLYSSINSGIFNILLIINALVFFVLLYYINLGMFKKRLKQFLH